MPIIDRSEGGYMIHYHAHSVCYKQTYGTDEIFYLFDAPISLASIPRAGFDLEHIATHVMDIEWDEYAGTVGLAFNVSLANPKEVFVWRWEVVYIEDDSDDCLEKFDDDD